MRSWLKDVDQLFLPRSHLRNICGHSKPPKHILLSYGVKTLTENVELIKMLNRLGHGVSYSQLEKKLHSFVPAEDGSKLKSEAGSSRDYST